jgi:hypothetical protein
MRELYGDEENKENKDFKENNEQSGVTLSAPARRSSDAKAGTKGDTACLWFVRLTMTRGFSLFSLFS